MSAVARWLARLVQQIRPPTWDLTVRRGHAGVRLALTRRLRELAHLSFLHLQTALRPPGPDVTAAVRGDQIRRATVAAPPLRTDRSSPRGRRPRAFYGRRHTSGAERRLRVRLLRRCRKVYANSGLPTAAGSGDLCTTPSGSGRRANPPSFIPDTPWTHAPLGCGLPGRAREISSLLLQHPHPQAVTRRPAPRTLMQPAQGGRIHRTEWAVSAETPGRIRRNAHLPPTQWRRRPRCIVSRPHHAAHHREALRFAAPATAAPVTQRPESAPLSAGG